MSVACASPRMYRTLAGNLTAAVNVLLAALRVGSQRVVLAGSYGGTHAGCTQVPVCGGEGGCDGIRADVLDPLRSLHGSPPARDDLRAGPTDTSKLVPYVTRWFLAGEAPALGSGRRPIDWVYVDDVVSAFEMAATASGWKAR